MIYLIRVREMNQWSPIKYAKSFEEAKAWIAKNKSVGDEFSIMPVQSI
jgi:hypothetical protein